ncbi:MAG: sucrose synthase [Cyanosarcina radialis HA8281-LM2]|jgi:sucrose synthase|nr:sucrose synthase [Cyanosarcina radialis HA8281-LM2]
MYELLQAVLNSDEQTALSQLVDRLRASGKRYFLRNEILQAFADYCHQSEKPAYFYHSSSLGKLVHYTHEIILEDESIWLVVRTRIASQEVWRLTADLKSLEAMIPQALLDVRDRLVNRYQPQILEIDFRPFEVNIADIDDPRNIGQGLAFLNRFLCDRLFTDSENWVEALFKVLYQHQHDGIPLLIGDRIHSGSEFYQQVKQAIVSIGQRPADEPYEKFHAELQELGLEPGWGNTAGRVRETLELLDRLIETPSPAILEAFVARIPAIFRVVSISIHGWVGQEGEVGRMETTGQVVYVLDQARYLENQLRSEIELAGLDFLGIEPQITILTRLIPNCEGTQCDLPLEKIEGTKNGWILRVPFEEFNPQVTRNWISKYEIWPYLEGFALESEKQLRAHFKGRPNLIIGHYTDGNLVAFLLARRLKVNHCHIAHSLEKPKNLFSDIHWQDLEDKYHFSAQFTADLIGMNAADFIITSSYQEIVGTPDTVGQYESYKCFTMPQLYHVLEGIDLFSPKFNRVPPGVNEAIFFPYTQTADRDDRSRQEVYDLLFTREDPQILGQIDNASKRPMLAIAPINSIKNLAGLVECFGKSQKLQEHCNLILITRRLHPSEAANPEQAEEIQRLHDLINEYQLHGRIRWIGMHLTHANLGEAYRVVADRRGCFVHFALFEAFGLIILEAMISGLPTFATQFGGSLEIIQDGDNGFHINPTDLPGTAERIWHFIEQCDNNPQYWHEKSEQAIARVREHYSWHFHVKQLLSIAKTYGFWNYVYRHNREALLRYLETLFHLIYKPRAEKILEQHWQR